MGIPGRAFGIRVTKLEAFLAAALRVAAGLDDLGVTKNCRDPSGIG